MNRIKKKITCAILALSMILLIVWMVFSNGWIANAQNTIVPILQPPVEDGLVGLTFIQYFKPQLSSPSLSLKRFGSKEKSTIYQLQPMMFVCGAWFYRRQNAPTSYPTRIKGGEIISGMKRLTLPANIILVFRLRFVLLV